MRSLRGILGFIYMGGGLLIGAQAQVSNPILITGEINDDQGQAISGCTVELSEPAEISTTTNAQGQFTLEGEYITGTLTPSEGASLINIQGTNLLLQVNESSLPVKVSLHNISGKLITRVIDEVLTTGKHSLTLPQPAEIMNHGIVILKLDLGGIIHTSLWNKTSQVFFTNNQTDSPSLKKSSRPPITIHCDGYIDQVVDVTEFTQALGTLTFELIASSGPIERIGTTAKWDGDGNNISIDVPDGTQGGDLFILALHRTDDDLPLFVDGWTRAAECYKSDNGNDKCGTEATCEAWHNDDFCQTFQHGGGHDLAQSVFYRAAGDNEPNSYEFDLNISGGGHPGWIILTTLRNAATTDPVRDWAGESSDDNSDSKFPSVNGEEGDMLILSQSFDDFEPKSAFTAPDGMEDWGYVGNSDETGYLFGAILTSSGETGVKTTNGPGASNNKDALVSLTIKPK